MKKIVVVVLLLLGALAHAGERADLVLVKKSEAKLYLIKDGKAFRQYRVVFGPNRKGHKQEDGDERTPEGRYVLDYKNANSPFYLSIHISYPNAADLARARQRGVDPGDDIMIHGQPQREDWDVELAQLFNWTDGCIAVSDDDMDEIWDAVAVGTPIEILP
jgi:murein L,D-transpeptidase YafK